MLWKSRRESIDFRISGEAGLTNLLSEAISTSPHKKVKTKKNCWMYLGIELAYAVLACHPWASARVLFFQHCLVQGKPASQSSCTTLLAENYWLIHCYVSFTHEEIIEIWYFGTQDHLRLLSRISQRVDGSLAKKSLWIFWPQRYGCLLREVFEACSTRRRSQGRPRIL